MRSLYFVIQQTFADCLNRIASPLTLIFPFLRNMYILPYEREILANCLEVRKTIQQVVDERRRDPNAKERGDFLQIILEDETTKDNNELIVDECLTFNFAGGTTSSVAGQNLIYLLCKHPHYFDQIRKEIDEQIVQPYLKAQVAAGTLAPGQVVSDIELLDLLTFDNSGELTFFQQCYNEALRIQPPVNLSSLVKVMQECKCDTVTIRPETIVSINMHRLCNDPAEWFCPDSFMPERFDPKSPYYLTPAGKPRNPFSFSPYLGG